MGGTHGNHLVEMIGAVQDMRLKGEKLPGRQITDLEEHFGILVGDGIDHHEALARQLSRYPSYDSFT